MTLTRWPLYSDLTAAVASLVADLGIPSSFADASGEHRGSDLAARARLDRTEHAVIADHLEVEEECPAVEVMNGQRCVRDSAPSEVSEVVAATDPPPSQA